MQAVHDVKSRKSNPRHPTQMASPNKFCSLPAVQALRDSSELLTSDAVFEPMQGKQPIVAVSLPNIIFGVCP